MTVEQIIAYHLNQLSEADRHRVEQYIKDNPEAVLDLKILEEVDASVAYHTDMRWKALMTKWSADRTEELHDLHTDAPRKRGYRWLWVLAILVVLALILFFIFKPAPPPPTSPVAEYYTQPTTGIMRGSPTNEFSDTYLKAVTAYGAHTDQALDRLAEVTPDDDNYGTARLLMLDYHMKNKEWNEALEFINHEQNNAFLSDPILQRMEWTRALILMETGQIDQAKEALDLISRNEGHLFHIKAKDVLEGM